ncbi:MAG: methionine--tRNA ligase [Acetobacteraceae bacterium]
MPSDPEPMVAPRRYITTPIYYVNDVPHIGHAYTTIACDVYARFMRLDGCDVFFLTGTDEHGQKVDKAAAAAGQTPQDFTDTVSRTFRDLAKTIRISNDDFIRTTEPRHHRACGALWRRLLDAGDLYLGDYGGWYAVRDEAFYRESETTVGEDGVRRGPSGAPVEWVKEPSWFFRLSAWQDRLLAFYEENPDFIAPASRRNEVISFVRSGLEDLSVSRTSFSWGVPVPGDERHVMYVWLDALTNYITAAGFPDETHPRWRFWPADVHVVGKDILRFHAVYWPAFLMSAGLPPPRRVFAHGWWTVEGQKMSKSLGNVVDPREIVAAYGLDPFRFFLLREIPFGADGDFTRRGLVKRLNVDLANEFGNLAQRTLGFIARTLGGHLPSPDLLGEDDRALLAQAEGLLPAMRVEIARQAFHAALEGAWLVVREANAYVDREKPWALRRSDPVRMGTVLWVLAETLRHLAILLQPVMPDTMARLLDQLGVAETDRSFAALSRPLPGGRTLPPPEPLFRKVEETAGQGA